METQHQQCQSKKRYRFHWQRCEHHMPIVNYKINNAQARDRQPITTKSIPLIFK